MWAFGFYAVAAGESMKNTPIVVACAHEVVGALHLNVDGLDSTEKRSADEGEGNGQVDV